MADATDPTPSPFPGPAALACGAADRAHLTGGLSDDALEAMLRATAQAIRLDIPADCLAGVRDNLRAVLAVADTLAEPDMPSVQVVELAPVYRA